VVRKIEERRPFFYAVSRILGRPESLETALLNLMLDKHDDAVRVIHRDAPDYISRATARQ
jgi:hypothetical protein